MTNEPYSQLDLILTAMERKHAFHLQEAARIGRDIAEYRRMRSEYPDPYQASSNVAPALAAPFSTSPSAKPANFPQSKAPPTFIFDGTFAGLIESYRSHERSSYHALKHKVRANYEHSLKRLVEEIGSERIADWNSGRVQREYDNNWAANGTIAMGHGMVGKLRLLTSFGSVVLNDDDCTRLSTILGNMRFPISRGRKEVLSMEQARAIRATAHNHFNWGSIALAQAFQITFPMLRQADVIGEWVPLSEPGTSEIVKGNEKWVRGLRWSDIDDKMVLRRVLTSGRKNQQKEVEFNLIKRGGIMEEINRVPKEKRVGPMIICEYSNLPWTTAEFRRKWRLVANKAGVPASVQNMDSVRANAAKEFEQLLGDDPKEYSQ